MKKIAIIGNGTAGCLTAAHFAKHLKDVEVEWYFDPNIKPQAVGEGSLVDLPIDLRTDLDFNVTDMLSVGGSLKVGIHKINWNGSTNFYENFPFGGYAMHFNAVNLQKFILDKVHTTSKVKIIEKNVSIDHLDVDHIVDCSGFPKDYSQHQQSNFIPVNSAFVTQCFWDNPKFIHTLTIARPYGWVFGIPLQNRCAIGYLYNSNVNSLDDIKADVQNVFDFLKIQPSTTTNHLNFKNYFRTTNFTERVSYNGNSSFFLEPLEATTISVSNTIKRWSLYSSIKQIDLTKVNQNYHKIIDEIETIIMLHYFNGSVFKTPFWDFAEERGRKKIESSLKSKEFLNFYNTSVNLLDTQKYQPGQGYGTWDCTIMNQNLVGLNLASKINPLINKCRE